MKTEFDYVYDERPYEIIDGEVRMMVSPSVNHTRINSNIDFIFKNYLKGKSFESFIETGVHLSQEEHFVPDEMIICNPDIVEENFINGVPDLIVEILSKSTAIQDRNKKFQKYEQYGVKEYWIVDQYMKRVEVFHLVDGKFVKFCDAQLYTDEEYKFLSDREKAETVSEIKVSLYDDFVVDVKDIFERVK